MFGARRPVDVRTAGAVRRRATAPARAPGTTADDVHRVRRHAARCAGSASRSWARWSPPAPCPRCGGTGQVIAHARAPTAAARAGATEEQDLHGRRPRRRRQRQHAAPHRPRRRRAAGRRRPATCTCTCGCGPTPAFARDGDDLVHDLHIPMTQAALGAHARATRPSTAPRTSSIPHGHPDRASSSGCGAGACPASTAAAAATSSCGSSSTRRPTSPASRRSCCGSFAAERGEEVAPADAGLLLPDPVRLPVIDVGAAPGAAAPAHVFVADLDAPVLDRPRTPPPRPRAAPAARRASPSTDGAGRWRPCRLDGRASSRRAGRARSRRPDAGAHRRLRPGQGRPARVDGAEADRARRRPHRARSRAARSVVRWDDDQGGRPRPPAAGGPGGGDAEPPVLAARGRPTSPPWPTSPAGPARPGRPGGGPPSLRAAHRAGRARRRLDRGGASPAPATVGAGPHVLRAETAAIAAGGRCSGAPAAARGRARSHRQPRACTGRTGSDCRRPCDRSRSVRGHCTRQLYRCVAASGPGRADARRIVMRHDEDGGRSSLQRHGRRTPARDPPPEGPVAPGGRGASSRSSRRPCSAPTSAASGPSRCRASSAWPASTTCRSTSCCPRGRRVAGRAATGDERRST